MPCTLKAKASLSARGSKFSPLETTAQVSFPCAPTEAVCRSPLKTEDVRKTTFTSTRVTTRGTATDTTRDAIIGYYMTIRVETEVETPSDFYDCNCVSCCMIGVVAMEQRRVS